MSGVKTLFITYLNASVSGGVIILLGLLLRPIFRKAPRRILCIVWLLAAVRLLVPLNIESQFSLQPSYEPLADLTLEQQYKPEVTPPEQRPNPEVPGADSLPDAPPQDIPEDTLSPDPVPGAAPRPLDWIQLLTGIWVTVMVGILVYCIGSYLALKHRIRMAVPWETGVLECENISGAFLLGYINPRIYLPVGLNEQDRAFILAHERTHIRRIDHWWKLIGVLCVAVHWYNPLVWIGYALLCRDIEITCDECVICSMDIQERKAYSKALLNSEKRRFGVLECPVAFGEVDLKQRIRNVLTYHPYGYWLTVLAVTLVVLVAFCFLTSPEAKSELNPEIPVTLPTEPTVTDPTVTAPTVTEPTATESVITEPTATEPVVTEPVVTDPPVTQPPATEPPETEPPVTEPPVTEPPVTVITYGTDMHGNRTFQLTSDGILTIYGTSEYDNGDISLWTQYADRITKIVMTEGCTRILYGAFRDFGNLAEVSLCESLEMIGEYAFYNCDSLRSVRIPANVTVIGEKAFGRCLALTKLEFAPNSQLTEIRESVFSATAITSFVAPPNLKQIKMYAFSGCWRLETVVLEGSVEKVITGAFDGCTRLKHVVLGETVVSALGIFRECGEIETIENHSQIPVDDLF